MTDQFSMFPLMISGASPNAISSQALADGAGPCASPESPTTSHAGRVALPANLSPSPGKDYPATIPATLHRILFGWSGPAAPVCCLASRSPARKSSERLQSALEKALRSRLSGHGSMIYRTGWKDHATPSGRRISRLRASAGTTSGSGPISSPSTLSGWPTPKAQEDGRTLEQYEAGRMRGYETRKGKTSGGPASSQGTLSISVQLAGWPSPTVGNATGSQMAKDASPTGRRPDGSKATVSLNAVAQVAGWPTACATDLKGANPLLRPAGDDDLPTRVERVLSGWSTPSARDWKDTAGMATTGVNPDGSERTRLDQLPRQAALAGWPTPVANDATGSTHCYDRKRADGTQPIILKLPGAAQQAGWPITEPLDPGNPTLTGSASAGTATAQTATEASATATPAEPPSAGNGTTMKVGSIAGWPTPMAGTPARNGNNMAGNTDSSRKTVALCGAEIAGHGMNLPETWAGPIRLTASGQILTGSSAEMESGGQLNPAFSAWLMGYPEEWCEAALSCQLPTRSRKAKSGA